MCVLGVEFILSGQGGPCILDYLCFLIPFHLYLNLDDGGGPCWLVMDDREEGW